MDHQRRGNGARPPSGTRQPRTLSYPKLKDLIEKTPEEILFTLRSEHNGFYGALNENKISKDKMALILIAVGKACKCDERHAIHSILKKVNSSSKFIYGNIQKYLCSLQNDGYDNRHLESLSYLIQILEELHKVLRAASSETVSILLPLFKSTVQKICNRENNNNVLSEILHKVEELENDHDNFIELFFSGQDKPAEVSAEQVEKPPDDFREIPILPRNTDLFLNSDPFLRPAIKDGCYHDTSHYLDVHFRLLHEDVIRPLREGIQEYIIYQKGTVKKQLKDAKLYRNVHIEKPVMLMSGLTHLISFEAKPFKHIVWENSRRLLFGSLLCLSHDNFQTMLFATVARRDSDKLKGGLLEVQFENPKDVFQFNTATSFVMMETNAYFEAYRHVLTALQEIKEDTFPLKEHIVECKTEVEPPQYLTQETTYNFQSLLVPNEATSSNEQNNIVEVAVLDTERWPPSKLLGLDQHQMNALKTALTNKLAIIQGPPGTGKTYIGLKIVKLLLNNCHVWNSLDKLSPILVVCYTNHALDQFLEGIQSFTDSIIRVGGRSSSPAMNAYQLNTLRAQLKNKREVPDYIFHNINESKLQLRSIQQKVAATERLIDAAKNTILTVEVLKNYMAQKHYYSFITAAEEYSPTLDKSTIIYEWLGLLHSKPPPIFENNEESVDSDATETHNLEDTADVGNEEYADVEYITDQRIVEVHEQEPDNQEVTSDPALGADFEKIQQLEKQMDNNWRVQGGYKERKKFIKKQLQLTNKMAKEEANLVKDIWDLSHGDRWKLYRMWIDEYIKQNVNNILESQETYEQYNKEYEEIRVQEDIYLMHNAKIVGMTTSGAAKYRNILQKIKPPIIIVEEAAEVLEAHIITSLTTSTQHLILIGDHQQLRPSPTVYELAKNYNLNLSLFERMIKNGMNYSKLLVQHRMRPCISQLLVPHIYKTLHDHSSVQGYENILGMEKNVFFVSHNFLESCVEDSKSRRNVHEAEFLIGLCRYLLLQGYSASQITVLTMYTGQMFLIKNRMKNSIFQGIRVTAVDNFQGEENDIILVSFVRSNDEGSIGFLTVSNRICVALSRAKKGLYCIGNFSLFAENNETWRKIITFLTENGMEGEALTLKCQHHQKKITEIVNGEDFNSYAPEGGCNILCDFRLACGHACTLSCHPYDREHRNFKCKKDCPKQCSNGHKCPKKCFEDCGPCLSIVCKQIPSCKHYISLPCSVNPLDVECIEPCPHHLPCGHHCQGECGKPCISCNVKIKSLALCGHVVETTCSRSNDEWEKLKICKKPCNKELDCGHMCEGNCGLCVQFRFHRPCTKRCNRILVCGHECKFPCAKCCPPCEQKCENQCVHSRCPATCGEKCSKCNEKCKWRCQHIHCTQNCGDKCDRVPCDKPCQKKLKCGHFCIGLCGERCPRLCRICDKNEVTEIFFGTEEELDARFIQLEDCSHIFEVSGLTHYLEMENTNDKKEVQMKSCPKCKTVIRRSLRFSNVIKSCLQQVEMVKEKVFGSISDNKEKQKRLLERATVLDTEKKEIKSTLCKLRNLSTCQIDLNIIDSIILKILHQLDDAESPHAQSLTYIDNYLIFLGDLVKICTDFSEWCASIENHKVSVEVMLWNFFSVTIQTILIVMDKNKSPTDQLLYDINQEIRRLMVFNALFQLVARTCHISNKSEDFLKFYNNAVCKLLTFGPLADDDIDTAKADIVQASKHADSIVLGISDAERKSIVKAMGLSQGHWFSCPNGHVYCITECGGAMEEGRCNECQATIGGHSHRLRGDNRLARAMDNARHAAWSDVGNMENYDFDHLQDFE